MTSAPAAGEPAARGFRPDIEGLRAVAIGLVLLYHAGLEFLPGGYVGVDVFFVISGFLITGMLLRELRKSGRISLTTFYARRVRRLVPAATLVLLTTAVLILTVGPATQRRTFTGDIVASAISLVNWRFADRSVDYQAEGIGASPVQHFWSLAVEEQFYIVWPLLIVVAALIATRLRWSVVRIAVALLAVVVVASFAWSVIETAALPARAFFVTTTRLWEMGIGALLAASVHWWRRLPRVAAAVLGWTGLAMIVASAFLVDADTDWPGAAALLPTLGTAAVIAAGTSDAGRAPRLLAWKPAVWVGGLSYSLYLWHWPLLIAAGWQWGELGQKAGLAIMALSFIPAWLSFVLVETPFRRNRRLGASPGLALSVGANLVAVSVVVALIVGGASSAQATSSPASAADLGARTLESSDGGDDVAVDADLSRSDFTPSVDQATSDMPVIYPDGCHLEQFENDLPDCAYGDTTADTRIVLAGDSKAAQWADGLARAGEHHGWRIEPATKSACPFADVLLDDAQGELYYACQEFGDDLEASLLADPPHAVVVSQRKSEAYDADGELSTEVMVAALADRWETLEQAGVEVIVLLDNPAPHGLPSGSSQVPECVAQFSDDLAACAFDRQGGVDRSAAPVMRDAAERVPEVDIVDMADTLCDETRCPPVIGQVLVYRQGTHITNTYALSAAGILGDRVARVLEPAE